jgi:hypothetical protein
LLPTILVHLVSCINWHFLPQARTDAIVNVQQQQQQLLLLFAASRLNQSFQTALLSTALEHILLQLSS